ncbi:condensin complex subunit 2-like [Olea europaea var. sylvestris]|uniref:condensin complex subunit 2-like n=1 Tax=Olea europaea var. sylvestris TaxID=158386 RepID=UPI000C1CE561|nr:condensin complex subunit 2-like [Olea europaea var. sylvestris]
MAETLSPNPKQRGPFSPSSPFFLGSNDDKLERAQARAARAAAVRRKPAAPTTATSPKADPLLGKEQILELFQNCIKLASENKINQKNTWELNLIDHLYEIIRVDEENDVETNFQKASCTLEAGVKIYSMRVDSVHSEAYKVLGGINRVGQEDEQDSFVENANIENAQEEGHSKKERERKLSPLSTLESSFEALNVKKFDVAFVVDPLYHQTSAQFDEGGAKGLLLNNLGVYGNCRVLFDSLEVPGRCSSFEAQGDGAEAIDISFFCLKTSANPLSWLDEVSPQRDDYGEMPSWDDEGGFGGTFDDGISYSDADESSTLVSQPRQVSKIEVQFDKTSKQVDVHLLKETLWGHMQKFNETSIQEETVSFRQVLANFPDECKEAAAAASVNDISPHLCFICLLHLANEHGLSIHGCPSLDDLTIQLK